MSSSDESHNTERTQTRKNTKGGLYSDETQKLAKAIPSVRSQDSGYHGEGSYQPGQGEVLGMLAALSFFMCVKTKWMCSWSGNSLHWTRVTCPCFCVYVKFKKKIFF